MKKITTTIIIALFAMNTFAQRTCGSGVLPIQFESWVSSLPQPSKYNNQAQSTFIIPIVIHIINNGEAIGTGANISNAQAMSQITVLNQDYNKQNPDTTSIPSVFKPALANCQITFCPAKVDPSGNAMAEIGIDRVNANTKGFSASPYSQSYIDGTIKPNTIWDPNKYLNVWCMDLGGGLLGYATFPDPASTGLGGLSAPYGSMTTDGVVILNTAFGNTGTAAAPYGAGRSATHEIGHWLGLRHVWGDANCGNDYCNDTPTEQTANYSCPTFPSVTCSNGPNGDMFMNYMDYVDDLCMMMFSKDQKTRMQLILANSPMRMNVVQSNKCNALAIGGDAGVAWVQTPAYNGTVSCSGLTPQVRIENYGSTTLTSCTLTYKVDAGAASTYSWTGSLAVNTGTAVTSGTIVTLPTITGLTNGAHIFSVTVSSPNGGADANALNNSNSQTFTVTGTPPTVTATSATVCPGQAATLTAGGATTYSWSTGVTTASTSATPAATTVYTVTGTSSGCSAVATGTITLKAAPSVTVTAPSICQGSSATIAASGATTYTWNTSATTSSITVTPASTTNYTVTGTSNGCTNTQTTSVTVNTTPTVSVNSSTICAGQTATLTASGATTYTWNTGASGASLSLTPASTGNYTVTGISGACSKTATTSITVKTTPVVSASSAAICQGSSTTLTASGATTYTWNTSATTSTVSVAPTTTTSYTVSGVTNGCSNSAVTTVTVNALPAVTANSSTICAGATANLTASGAATYTWNTGSNASSINVTPTANTNYTVVGTSSTGCQANYVTSVIVNSAPNITVNSATVCAGSSANLTASGVTSYTWNTGSNSTNISVSPSSTTVYTVSGNASGCPVAAVNTATVTVNALPSVSANNTSVCQGSSANLTASGASTYTWSTGSNASSINVSPTANTSYTVTGMMNGCLNSAVASVTVNSLPTITANSSTICTGATANLAASGASSYTWSTGSTGSSINVSPTAYTTYTVVGTSPAGCQGMYVTSVAVTSAPNITVNSATVCAGSSANLIASGVTSYTWNTGSNSTNISVSPSSTTVYTVSGNGSGCPIAAVNTATVTVNPLPTVALAAVGGPLCSNSPAVTLNGTPAGGTYSGTGVSGNTFNPSVSGTGTFTLTYTYTNSNNCSSSDSKTVMVSGCTGIENQSASAAGISVYPNPVQDVLNIKFDNAQVRYEVEVYDAIGKLVYSTETNNDTVSISASTFAKGLYTLRIKANNKQLVSRFIKE